MESNLKKKEDTNLSPNVTTTFSVELEDGHQISSQEDEEAYGIYQDLEDFRGWLISEVNIVEALINQIIENALFLDDQTTERNLFNEYVLNTRPFTYGKRDLC